jgi:integrase
LSPLEIKLLKELQHISEEYIDSYSWLLIGLCIGQRVSDLLKLTLNDLRKATTGLYIDILQQKTKKAVTVVVEDPQVIEILKNEFPRKVSQVIFNKQIKALCRITRINELIDGFKNNPKIRRKEIVNAPKYAFVTSHIMRRSFASN